MTIRIHVTPDHVLNLPDDTSQADVDSYVNQILGEPTQEPTWLSSAMSAAPGVAKAAATGLVKGAADIAGLPGDVRNLVVPQTQPKPYPEGWYGGLVKTLEDMRGAVEPPSSEQIVGGIKKAGVPMHEPENTAERYAQGAAEFVPGALAGPGSWYSNLMRYGIAPGLASQAAGDVAQHFAPDYPGVKAGAQIAAAVATPGAVSKLVSPNAARLAEQGVRKNFADTLKSEGVTPTAGDILNDPSQRFNESQLNPGIYDKQLRDFTAAASRRIGMNDPHLTIGTAGNLPQRADEIRQQFDAIPGRNTFQADPDLYKSLLDTHDFYHRTPGLYDDATVNAVDGAIGRVSDVLKSGNHQMSGPDYQQLRSDLRDAAMSSTDPGKAGALHDVTNALDDSFERHLQRTGSPDAQAMPQLRKDYRSLLTVEKARVKQGNVAGGGYITPANLQSAAKSVYGNLAYERGNTPFTDLAEAGSALITPRPDSGTAGRTSVEQRVRDVAKGVGGAGGAFFGATHGGVGPGVETGVLGLLGGELAAPFLEAPVRGAMKVMATNPVAQARQMSEFMPAYRQAPTVPGALPALSARDQAMIRALMQGNIAAQQQTPQVNVGVRPGYFGQQ